MAYKQAVRYEAFVLFCEGASIGAISKHFDGKPSAECISAWRKQGGWDDLRDKLAAETTKKLLENLSDFNARQYQHLEETIDELLGKLGVTGAISAEEIAHVICELIRTQRLLIGYPTDHLQFSGAILDTFIEREIKRLLGMAECEDLGLRLGS